MKNYSIKQNGEVILDGDKTSISMIFNNMIGKNIKGDEYLLYLNFVKREGFDLNKPFELVCEEKSIQIGHFKTITC